MVRGDASSPLTVDSDSSHGGDETTSNKTPPTDVATMTPPTTNIFPNETTVYKFFSNKKQCFWGRVIDYHLDKEYLVRYHDDDATVENVSQAELEYIAKAAETALSDKKPSGFSIATHNEKPKKRQLFPNLNHRPKRQDKDDQQKTSWGVARSDKDVDLYDTSSNDDDHGDDDNDDDEKQDNRKVYTTRKRRSSTRGMFLLKNARLKQKEFWEANEDDSNDDDDMDEGDDERRHVFGGSPTDHAFATCPAKPIELSEAKKAAELAKIPVESNRALQKILFDTGRFRMTLMEHQFLAVREVAGVPKDYPMHEQSVIQSAERANIAESLLNWPVDPNLDKKKRGVLIADEMVRFVSYSWALKHVLLI